jgi:integrase
MYSDGGGLYLQVGEEGGAKSWIFRFSRRRFGKAGEAHMGLGSAHTFSLDEAREMARECRQQIKHGIDPLEAHRTDLIIKQAERAKIITFDFAADDYLAYKRRTVQPDTYRNISNAFRDYLKPAFDKLAVSDIDHLAVHRMVVPIYENTKTHGEFVRMQLKAMLDRAKGLGWRTGDNPAALDGPLGVLVRDIERSHIGTPRAALPFQEMRAFMVQLSAARTQNGKLSISALALEFTILTAARVSQVTGLRWDEIDFDKRIWTCPWQRTKTGKKTQHNHVIMLSKRALAVLMQVRQMEVTSKEFVFVSQRDRWNGRKPHLAGTPIERHAPSVMLGQTMKRNDITVHGFRTAFSSWANENRFPDDAIEISLDHEVGNKIRRLYARDAKHKQVRHDLMEAWAEFCSPPEAEVVPFRQTKGETRHA